MSTTTAIKERPIKQQQRYKLILFIPASHLEVVKKAVFATGAGSIGLYDQTCFQVLGTAQFTPSAAAKPFLGKPGEREEVEEWKVETQCRGREEVVRAVEAFKRTHPYEEAVYEVYKLEDF